MPHASASLLAAYAAALLLTTPSFAKTPGEIHCYNGICHRVKSVDEMTRLVGMETEDSTSFYDSADKDRMNAGTITSSGEEFDADSDAHAASAYYPDGTELLVWNPKNRKAAHIRVNDFGPFFMMRTIDVTRGVAEKLDFVKAGVAKLKITVIWAPGRDEARYRRLREYPAVEGYLGQLDTDQLTALKCRLISTAPARNGRHLEVASASVQADAPRYSLINLPAYVTMGPDNAAARRIAAIMNAPRFAVGPTAVKLTVKAAPAVLRLISAIDAPDGTGEPAPAPVAIPARDAGEILVGALDASIEPATLPVTRAAGTLPQNRPAEIVTASVWPANQLWWQQLLAALGLLSVSAVTLRSRQTRAVRATSSAAASSAAQDALAAARVVAAAGTEFFSGVPGAAAAPIALPHLPSVPAGRSLVALRDEAIACMERHAYGEAEAAYRTLLAAREAALGAFDPLSASAERQLADCVREQGLYARAEPHYHRALTTMAAAAGDMHPATADILDEYASCVLRQGYGSRAETLARQSLAVRRATTPRGREAAVTLSIVAETLRAQGQLVAAEIEHRASMALLIAECGPESLEVAASQLHLGTLLAELGRYGAAEDVLNQATRKLTVACGPSHPAAATAYARLGDLYRRAGAQDAALSMHTHALDIRQRLLGARHPDTIESLLTLSSIEADQYRSVNARVHLDRALDALIGAERIHFGPQSRTRSLLVTLSHHFDTAQPRAIAAQ